MNHCQARIAVNILSTLLLSSCDPGGSNRKKPQDIAASIDWLKNDPQRSESEKAFQLATATASRGEALEEELVKKMLGYLLATNLKEAKQKDQAIAVRIKEFATFEILVSMSLSAKNAAEFSKLLGHTAKHSYLTSDLLAEFYAVYGGGKTKANDIYNESGHLFSAARTVSLALLDKIPHRRFVLEFELGEPWLMFQQKSGSLAWLGALLREQSAKIKGAERKRVVQLLNFIIKDKKRLALARSIVKDHWLPEGILAH